VLSAFHHLADMRRNYGTGAALKWVADRAARRLLGASFVRVLWLEADWLPECVRPGTVRRMVAGLEFRFLEPYEVRHFSADPAYELDAAMAERIENGGDFCFGAMAERRLPAYSWFALDCVEAEHAMGAALSFPPDVAYMYKGLTQPDFRGRRIHGLVIGLALRELAEYGVTKLVSLVESINWPSRRSCARLGFVDLGLRICFGRGRARLLRAPRAARELGVRFGKHARRKDEGRGMGDDG
jgi:hypothetical protein